MSFSLSQSFIISLQFEQSPLGKWITSLIGISRILAIHAAKQFPFPTSKIVWSIWIIIHQIKGLIIGKPVDETYYEEYKNLYLEVIQQELKLKELFVGYNYNFGHTAHMCVLPIGIKVRISAFWII